MSMTAEQLSNRLQFDFTAADLGDSAAQYAARLTMIAEDAVARENVSDAERVEGARYLLLAAQLRQLGRQVEEFRAEGELTVKQDLATRMAQLRREQQDALALSGLPVPGRAARVGSMSIPVESSF